MSDFRIVLIIIGALVLTALLVHGLWTVRKNSGQPKHRYYDESKQPDEALPTKTEGFDELGLGEVRVVRQGAQKSSVKVPANSALSTPAMARPTATQPITARPVSARQEQQTELAFTANEEPELNFSALAEDDQSSLPPDDTGYQQDDSGYLQDDTDEKNTLSQPSEVLILYVLLAENEEIKGEDLLSTLLTLGFKYGDMDIFHRHTDSSGSGEVLFSLANMFNPGTFDLDNMDKLNTRGVSLFMTLPGPGDALQNFNLMHNAAKKLASEFSGQVLDGQRSVLTVQTVRHYVDKIREFQRQKLIHG